jgi:hypothetical protein
MYQFFNATWRFAIIGSFLSSLVSVTLAQGTEPINVDSLTSLPAIGRVETLTGNKLFKLFPLEGTTFLQRVDFPSASSFRLHFSVLAPKSLPAGSWSVRIINFSDDRERWALTPQSSVNDFWSSEIKGSRARVVIRADAAVADKLQVIIDKVAFLRAITIPQTMINSKLQRITKATDPIRLAGRAVARLVIQPDGKDAPVSCTGFLVGNDILMTNRHCIRSGSEARDADVQFDYDEDDAEPVQVAVKELLLTSCDLDFVLLRLDQSFACKTAACNTAFERRPLPLARNPSLISGQTKLVAIQHPDGEAKQVSTEGCIADQLGLMGSSSTLTDFAHKCDTKEGSSGTPVQLISDTGTVGAVVGLHHLGFRLDSVNDEAPKQINRAVNTREIIAYITRLRPALLVELALQ